MQEKLSIVKEKLLHWAKEFWLFISSLFFLRHTGMMLGVLLFLFLTTNWWLSCYTRHGDSLKVDELVNMSLQEATKVVQDKGFKIEVLDSTYLPNREGGVVLSQTPKPLSNVKKGRTIYITTTKFDAEMVQLPLLSESSYDYQLYSRKLSKSNYQLKTKIREPKIFTNRQEENTILHIFYGDQKIEDNDLAEGVQVPMGATLEFVVTTQVSSIVAMPRLVCQDYEAAEFLITSARLKVGNIIEDNTVINRSSAYVWKQEPAFVAGKTIQKETAINLYLTQNRPESCEPEF